jgi:glucose/arabinose dehydrogenase
VSILACASLVIAVPALSACNGSDPAQTRPATAPATTAERPAVDRGGAAAITDLRRRRVGTFSSPTYVTAPRGDRRRLFVVEQEGTIRVIHRGRKVRRPFLDIRDRVQAGGEQGLLSMAFSPRYRKNRRFYVYYTANGGDIRVVEFRGRRNRARRGSARRILGQEHSDYGNHNGGQLQFGPDGRLYIGLGDGGGGGDPFEAGQDLGTHLGKILRINPRGRRIPRSNPFRGRRGAKPAVYSYGLRNPWRFSFDRKTGDLTVADVGQNAWEEVNFVRRGRGAGANFGWDAFEATHRYEDGPAPGHIPPVIEHSHDGDGFCSITGGYVLRHRSYRELRGTYVYGDLCEGRVRAARLSPGRATGRRVLSPRVSTLSSFGEDSRGRVYAASLDGPVYRLVPRR